MTIEIALALLAFSAPVTAAIVVMRPPKKPVVTPVEVYLTTREFDNFRNDLNSQMHDIAAQLEFIKDHIT